MDNIIESIDSMKYDVARENENLSKRFEDFKAFEIANNDIKCEGLMKNKLKKYEQVYIDFKQFFDANELIRKLD